MRYNITVDPDELDRHLDAVLIGGREPRAIEILEYDPGWPELYEEHRARILTALGASAIRMEHVGSTSVPGLAAKPIIDVLVTVLDADDEEAFRAALESAGYELRVREDGHRMFRPGDRSANVHVWSASDPEVVRMLSFRDQLRASAEDRHAYEQLKRRLAQRDWADVNHYANAKGPFIEAVLSRAQLPGGSERSGS